MMKFKGSRLAVEIFQRYFIKNRAYCSCRPGSVKLTSLPSRNIEENLSRIPKLIRFIHSQELTREPESFNTDQQELIFSPPKAVRGLKNLDEQALLLFDKTIQVPFLTTCRKFDKRILSRLRKYLLSQHYTFKNLVNCSKDEEVVNTLMLNPDMVNDNNKCEVISLLNKLGVKDCEINWKEVTFKYENWSAEQVINAILPKDLPFSSYVVCGHIAQVNLRGRFLEYKGIIGKVLLDKILEVRTVVNKLPFITSTYRNFDIEVLAGENNMLTRTSSLGCIYELNFSKVYWNSRLDSERETVVCDLPHGSRVYDVFAGVGPFAIKAGKQKVTTLANDLNPSAYEWLQHNVKLNKVHEYVACYNIDGREFLKTVVKDDLIEQWKNEVVYLLAKYYIIMNLPVIAVDFLDVFPGLFSDISDVRPRQEQLPIVHCYSFIMKSDDPSVVIDNVCMKLNNRLSADQIQIKYVRDVSIYKCMMRATFTLTEELLFKPVSKH